MGKLDSLTNQDKADLNEDGKITAYDAELFLSRLGQCVVELPANGEVKVTVTITLPIMERGDDSTQIAEATAEKAAPPSDAAVHLNKLDLSDIEDN